MRRLAGIFAILMMCLAGAGGAQTPPLRIALVIGNGAYQRPAWVLPNPPRDADLMAQRLAALGFQVDLVRNANRQAMEAAFTRFGQRLRAGGKATEGVFFYAGHGAQQDGVNYLVPVDADARTADQLRFQAPAMQFLLDDMAAAGNAVNLIILDACRDMPLEQGFRGGAGGLADNGRLPNIFIAYAASPGRTASDGGGANSPFTATLAKFLSSEPNETIGQLFADVNAAVYTSTGGAQSPEYRNGLVRAPRWSFGSAAQGTPTIASNGPVGVGRTVGDAATPAKPPTQTASLERPPTPSSPADQKVFRDCADCPEMVRLSGGTFMMGSPATEAGRDNDEAQHRETVAAFAAGRYEVTFAQWDACVAAHGCGGYSPIDQGWGRGDRPVINVSWNDAQQYAQWLSQQTGQRYRLLREAEWEYAARAGTTTPYSTGATIAASQANFTLGRTQPVGSNDANPFGLFDMHGNVYEWVEECYVPNCSLRVVRGGSWSGRPLYLRSARRAGSKSILRDNDVGFRVARTL